MPNFETITIAGHLGKDAEMRETNAGHVTNFTVAVNYGKKDNRKVTWFDISCWHEVAKGCEHLRKGDAVVCVGKMRERKWVDEAGAHHSRWSLQADVVGKCLYVKDEPTRTHEADYHSEPVDDRGDGSFEEPEF